MIAFACATSDERRFRAAAMGVIEAVAEPDALLMRRHTQGSLAGCYDAMLAEAAAQDGLEAVVLLDQSLARVHEDLPARLRRLLAANADVAVVGTGDVEGAREAEAVGGGLVALSAWAARELRCDPEISGALDPLAIDLSFQARAHGRRVVVSGALGAEFPPRWAWPANERRAWVRSAAAVRRKWGPDRVPRSAALLPLPMRLDSAVSACSH